MALPGLRTSSFSCADLVGAMLDSLLARTDPHSGPAIVEDAATDDSVAEIESYAARDARIRLIARSGAQGRPLSECRGRDPARHDYVVVLDPDEIVLQFRVGEAPRDRAGQWSSDSRGAREERDTENDSSGGSPQCS